MALHVTPTRRTAYHGSAADVFTVARSKNAATRSGERVVVMTWLDDASEANGGHPAGTVVARHIEGDGRTDEFKVHDTAVNPADPIAYATGRLS